MGLNTLKPKGAAPREAGETPGPLTRIVSAPCATTRTPMRNDDAWAPATKHQEDSSTARPDRNRRADFWKNKFGTLRSE